MYIVSIKDKEGVLIGVFTDEQFIKEEVSKRFDGGEYRATELPRFNELFLVRKEK
jgi:hypothetical protein